MKVEANLSYTCVPFEKSTDAHLVVSLTAPAIAADTTRPKLAIVVCVDTSGSMGGAKLNYAKLSIEKMLEHMKPDDYLGVVEFSNSARTVTKPERLTAEKKETVKKSVRQLQANGGTNFAGGMLTSIDLLKDLDLGVNYIHRVIMFTDGQANAGPATKPTEIIKFFKANAPDYITASAFGYGHGGSDFDPDFLADFAREAKGNYAHVQNPDNALQAFGIELGGLTSTYATNIRLSLSGLAGHSITKVISDVESKEEDGQTWVTLSDILAEETRNIVLAVKLSEQKTQGPRAVNVFEAKVFYDTFDTLGKKESNLQEIKAKTRFVKTGEEKKAEGLDNIIGLAVLSRAQIEAEVEAKKGNFKGAQNFIAATQDWLAVHGHASIQGLAKGIHDRMDSAESYRASTGYLKGMSRGITRGMGGSYSTEVAEELTSVGVVTTNSVQYNTSNSFSGTGAVIDPNSGGLIIDPNAVVVDPKLVPEVIVKK